MIPESTHLYEAQGTPDPCRNSTREEPDSGHNRRPWGRYKQHCRTDRSLHKSRKEMQAFFLFFLFIGLVQAAGAQVIVVELNDAITPASDDIVSEARAS